MSVHNIQSNTVFRATEQSYDFTTAHTGCNICRAYIFSEWLRSSVSHIPDQFVLKKNKHTFWQLSHNIKYLRQ